MRAKAFKSRARSSTRVCCWTAGVDRQPQLWHNPWAGLYVVSVCFFIGLFWVNLLQGAIIDNYCRLIEEMGVNMLVSL